MDPLQIHLFGGFLVERDHMTLPPIASRTGRSLFAYLVMHPDRPLQRDYLAGMFWPEIAESRARRRLSHTLWQIQDVLNTDSTSYLDVTSDTLAFNTSSDYWLDVDVFDKNFEAGSGTGPGDGFDAGMLRSCVELYRGDFLAGYFDDWVLVEQDHYRQRYLLALSRLVDATKANGAYEEALAFARRLTHHDPLSEEAHQEVMRLSFLLGRTSEAIEQFERCRSVLEEELGTEPSAPTVEIYDKIIRQRRSGIRPLREDERKVLLGRRADVPFVGREHERRILVDSFERVLSGSGGVVLVEGEPGVGKTRTTLEAAEDARWRGFEVSWGTCHPGALRPFAPLIEVLESLNPIRVEQLSEQVSPVWLGEVAKLVPALANRRAPQSSALRPAEESARMIEALIHTLGALGGLAPHLVIIDDVHWADQDTLSVLTQLGSRLADSRVLLMLLYRSEEARGDAEVWDVMRDLDRAAGLGRVVLSPLSVFELEEVVRRIIGATRLDSAVASRLHRQTGGNVLFTLETLLSIRDRGLFEAGADPGRVLEQQTESSGIPVAPRVRSVIESRLSLLGDGVTTVYKTAAIVGDRVDLSLLEEVTGMPRSKVLVAVDDLLDRGLFVDDGISHFRIAHDQVRQVVYEEMAPTSRQEIHMRVARTLAGSMPDDVETIGHHFREGGDPEQATSFLKMAGLRALELNAYSTASSHLRSACEAAAESEVEPPEMYTMLGHLEDVLNVLGHREEQRDVVERMSGLAIDLPGLNGDVERRRAWLLAQIGQLPEAQESAALSVEVERKDGDATGLATSLVALGTIQRWAGRPLEAVPALTEAVEAAEDGRHRADALTELASTLVEVQETDPALSHLTEAGTIYRGLDDLRGQAEVAGIEARIHRQHGRRDQAIAGFELAIDLCRRIGYRHGEGVNLTNLSNIHQLSGAVADSLRGYDQAARIFAELGNRRGEATVLANSASARHNLLGEDERARADALTAMRHFTEIGDRARRAQCEEILAGVAARNGRRNEARQMLRSSVDDLEGSGNAVLQVQHLRSLALLDIEDGSVETALSTLDEADLLCANSDLTDLAVELTSVRAMAHLADDDPATALELTSDAVSWLSPGVERPHLIHHRHALAAEASGIDDETRTASINAETTLKQALAGLGESDYTKAVLRVPEHHEIVTRAAGYAPRVIEVELPAIDAPTGKSLDSEDLRPVRWTVEHPEDELVGSDIERRRRRLIRLIEEAAASGAEPSMDQLAEVLSVSSSTVRRDLHTLRAEGHSLHTRGHRKTG